MKPSQLPELGRQIVAFDTETSGLHFDDGATISVVSVAYMGERGIESYAFPFDHGTLDKEAQSELFGFDDNLDEAEWEALGDWLAGHRLVAHNAKFDLHMMRTGTRHWPGRDLQWCVVWDTILGAKELDPTKPTGLESAGKRIGLQSEKEGHSKAIRAWLTKHKKGKGRYDLVPWELMGPYAADDARDCLLIYLDQLHRIQHGEGSFETIEREIEVMKMLYRLEWRGIGLDVPAALDAAGVLMQQQSVIAKQMPFKPTKAAAIRWFFSTCGEIPSETTPTGQIQLTDKVVERLADRDVPGAKLYRQYRKIDVALSMWYSGYVEKVGPDGRLRTVYRQTKESGRGGGGAVSGRFSVERVQLHAIPHKSRVGDLVDGDVEVTSVRGLFIPKEGYELWEADLAQAEARVAAKLAECQTWLDMITERRDMHGETAARLFDVADGDADWFKYRQVAKRANFSLIFGVGPFTFRQTLFRELGIDMPEHEVERIIHDWRALYPEFGRAIRRAQRIAERKQRIALVGGGYRWFWPGEPEHKAFNQQVQGSLAEFAKRWAVATDAQFGGRLLLLVHDSEVLECEKEAAESIMSRVAGIGKTMGTDFFEVPMDVDYGRFEEH